MTAPVELENVFGSADGSTYSAVLAKTEGVFTVDSLLIDGHNMPAPRGTWTQREDAVKALAACARGDRQP